MDKFKEFIKRDYYGMPVGFWVVVAVAVVGFLLSLVK